MRRVLLSTALLTALALPAQAGPLTIFNITGSWLNVPPGDNTDGATIIISNQDPGQLVDTIRWGGPDDILNNRPLSGYNFDPTDGADNATPAETVNPGTSVLVNLGKFDHINEPIDDAPSFVNYDFAFQTNATSAPVSFTVQLRFEHTESDNTPGPPGSDDTVEITLVPIGPPNVLFTQGPHQYLFDLLKLGFDDGFGNVTLIDNDTLTSPEDGGSTANLYARITSQSTAVPEPATMIMFGSGLTALAAYRRRRRES